MSDTYTLNEIAMMFEILNKSGKLEEINKKFPDLNFTIGDQNTQKKIGQELWSALEDIKEKDPSYYKSVVSIHGNLDRPVPCPCRPRKA